MSQTVSKLISFRVDPTLYDLIAKKAKDEHRPVSNYIKKILIEDLDTTDYLLSTETNKNILFKAVKQAEQGKVKTFKTSKEILKYVQNLADSAGN